MTFSSTTFIPFWTLYRHNKMAHDLLIFFPLCDSSYLCKCTNTWSTRSTCAIGTCSSVWHYMYMCNQLHCTCVRAGIHCISTLTGRDASESQVSPRILSGHPNRLLAKTIKQPAERNVSLHVNRECSQDTWMTRLAKNWPETVMQFCLPYLQCTCILL